MFKTTHGLGKYGPLWGCRQSCKAVYLVQNGQANKAKAQTMTMTQRINFKCTVSEAHEAFKHEQKLRLN